MAFSENISDHFIWRIASLSPLAAKRLEIQDYRHHLLVDEDGPDEQLFDLMQSLLLDLEEIGVSYGEPINELFQSDQNVEDFLNLMDYIFPCSLYLKLKDDKTLQTGVHHMLDGTNDESILNEWLTYLKRYDPSMVRIINHFKPQLVGNDTFEDYLLGLNNLLSEQHIEPILDLDRLEAIDRFITKLKSGLERLESIPEVEECKSFISRNITQTEHLLRDPKEALRVGAWLKMRLNTTPKSYRPFYLKMSKSILASIPLGVDFYLARKIDIASIDRPLAISTTLLGWAANKYNPKRYKDIFPDLVDWMSETLMGELTHE